MVRVRGLLRWGTQKGRQGMDMGGSTARKLADLHGCEVLGAWFQTCFSFCFAGVCPKPQTLNPFKPGVLTLEAARQNL